MQNSCWTETIRILIKTLANWQPKSPQGCVDQEYLANQPRQKIWRPLVLRSSSRTLFGII